MLTELHFCFNPPEIMFIRPSKNTDQLHSLEFSPSPASPLTEILSFLSELQHFEMLLLSQVFLVSLGVTAQRGFRPQMVAATTAALPATSQVFFQTRRSVAEPKINFASPLGGCIIFCFNALWACSRVYLWAAQEGLWRLTQSGAGYFYL